MADEDAIEVTTFVCKECYVYAPLPPITSLGHRAELWNVDKWLREVKMVVVRRDDDLYIRLLDLETGELFGECPLPNDAPTTTAVEPVTDSSRYFALKLVDRSSKKHAFIGVGFRERMHASDFNAAIDDHRQYLRRKKEAEQMQEEFSSRATEDAGPSQDYSLRGTIKLNLSKSMKNKASPSTPEQAFKAPSIVLAAPDQPGVLKLAPPPASVPSPSATSQPRRPSLTGDAGTGALSPPAAGTAAPALAAAASAAPTAASTEAAADDDDWGDFVS